MRKSITPLKRLIILVYLLFIVNLFLSAQVYKTVYYNSAADSLSVSLTSTEKITVTDLTIITASGVYLTNGDFAIMGAMTVITNLDLSGASIAATPVGKIPASFTNKKSLKSFKFPKNVRDIAANAFTGSGLSGVFTIPATINGVGNIKGRMDNCSGITAFAVESGSTTIKAVDGVLYSYDGTILALYPSGRTGSTYDIPEGTTTIYDGALAYNLLTSFSVPSTLTTFGTGVNVITGANNLQNINVAPGNAKYANMGAVVIDKVNKTMVAYPIANEKDTLIIDGSLVTKVPQYIFQNATKLKTVVITEGVVDIGYCAFRNTLNNSAIEYIELPSTLLTVQGQAFSSCSSLKQIICKATMPPDILNNATFFVTNRITGLLIGVPAVSLSAYQTSKWIETIYPAGIGFTSNKFVAYRNITVGNKVTCSQTVAVPTKSVSIIAGSPDPNFAFSYWEATPSAPFANKYNMATSFVMPDNDIVISAVYKTLNSYTIVDDATISTGQAPVGGVVTITTKAEKSGYAFVGWEVIEGDGVVFSNPKAVTTTFIMIDGAVTIRAKYQRVYTINIEAGYANLEAIEGENVSIEAEIPYGYLFDKWTATTFGLSFLNSTSANTTFVMPASDVYIKANFKMISAVDKIEDASLAVYPNPASESIRLLGAGGMSYNIYDLNGRVQLQGSNYNGQPISLAPLNKGAYLIKINMKVILFLKK